MINIIQDIQEEIPSKISEAKAENVVTERPDPFTYVLFQEVRTIFYFILIANL